MLCRTSLLEDRWLRQPGFTREDIQNKTWLNKFKLFLIYPHSLIFSRPYNRCFIYSPFFLAAATTHWNISFGFVKRPDRGRLRGAGLISDDREALHHLPTGVTVNSICLLGSPRRRSHGITFHWYHCHRGEITRVSAQCVLLMPSMRKIPMRHHPATQDLSVRPQRLYIYRLSPFRSPVTELQPPTQFFSYGYIYHEH